jgi:hypothetical protein
MNTTYAMTLTTLQRTFLAVSIALMCASVCVAQTPATPDAPPATPTTPAAGEAKPESPDAKGATPEGKGNQRRPRRPAVQPEAAAPAAPAEASPLAPLAWLEGCWSSNVNRRETREHWLPLRGNLMLGMSQTVLQGKTQDYEYLRIESRPEGVYYVALPSGQNATSFKYEGKTTETMGDRNDDLYTFTNPTLEFPQKIVYRRATQGWLYASVSGKVAGNAKEVTYPMRRIDCETGEVIER